MATHAVGQLVPSRYLPVLQELQWVLRAPVHSAHWAWQLSHVPELGYFPTGQLFTQEFPKRTVAPGHERH